MTTKCPVCGYESLGGFCGKCGASLLGGIQQQVKPKKKVEQKCEEKQTPQTEEKKYLVPTRRSSGFKFYDKYCEFTVELRDGLFNTKTDIIKYSNIKNFEIIEDGASTYKGGLGGAAVGALLFGPAGAVAGAIVGGQKANGSCSSLIVRVNYKTGFPLCLETPFIDKKVNRDSLKYRNARAQAEDLVRNLQKSIDIVEKKKKNLSHQKENDKSISRKKKSETTSAADEIRKFKSLMDDGIITKDEFEAKKRQLLGL